MTFLLVLLGSVSLIGLGGLLYQAIGSARDARRYPAPGEMVDVGGHRLHMHKQGYGGPTVVLESGIAASSVSWQLIQSEVAKFTTVVSYDRAGLGWSDASRASRSIGNILRDLETLLARAGIEPPIVLVGHSFGGLVALEYACGHRERVAGLVLVDPLPASEWRTVTPQTSAMLRRGITLARRGAWVARLGIVRLSLDLLRAGSRRIPKLAARVSSGNGSKLTERLVGEVRKLPKELWPVVQYHWCDPKCFLAMADHLEALPENARACDHACKLGDLPVVVLSAANSDVDRTGEHQEMAACSACAKFVSATHSGHWIQLDEPGLVVAAIRQVVELTRQPQPRELQRPAL